MASSARIDELKKKFDENPRRYFAPLANEYRKAGSLEQAIDICRTHLADQPGHMSGHIVFGQALFEAGRHEDARRTFETALSLDPENLIALRHLGDIARDGGDHAGALQWYQRVLDADPRNEEILAQIEALGGAAPDAVEAPAAASDEEAGWPSFAHTPPGNEAIPEPAAPVAPTGTRVMSPAELGIGADAPGTRPEAPVEAAALEEPVEASTHGFGDVAPVERVPAVDASALPTLEVPAITPSEPVASLGVEHTALDHGEPSRSAEDIPSILDEAFPEPAAEPLGFERTSMEIGAFEPTSFDGGPVAQGEDAATELTADDPAAGELAATGFESTASSGFGFEAASQDPGYALQEPASLEASQDASAGEAATSDASLELPSWDAPLPGAEAETVSFGHPADAGTVGSEGGNGLVFLDESLSPPAEGRATAGLPIMYEPEEPVSASPAFGEPTSDGSTFDPAPSDPMEPVAAVGTGEPAAEEAASVVGAVRDDSGMDDEARPLDEPAAAPFVTETMAELYVQQGYRDQAIAVYRQLVEQRPEDERLRARLAELDRADAAIAEEPVAGGAEEVVLPAIGTEVPTSPSTPAVDERRAARAHLPSILDVLQRVASHRPGTPVPPVETHVQPPVETPVETPAAEPVSPEPIAEPVPRAVPGTETVPVADSGIAALAAPEGIRGDAPTSDAAGTIDGLFGGTTSARDEAAARTLAAMFGSSATTGDVAPVFRGGDASPAAPARAPEPIAVSGAPTRPAGDELSLDTVFNEPAASPAAAPRRSSSSFSFDQFFADSGTPAAPAAPEAPAAGGSSNSGADIEQFNAWLDGLKKK